MAALLADLYTPLLALLTLGLVFRCAVLRAVLPALILAEVLMFLLSAVEYPLGLWQRWGLDFSTHTAVLLPLLHLYVHLLQLSWREPDRLLMRWPGLSLLYLRLMLLLAAATALVSALLYAALMLQLGYHSIADMLTTAISSYPLAWIAFYLLSGRETVRETA